MSTGNVVCAFGAPGSGKTSVIIALLWERRISRYLVCEPYTDIPAYYRVKGPGTIGKVGGELNTIPEDEPFSISYMPAGEKDEIFAVTKLGQYAKIRQNTVLVIDEAYTSCQHHVAPDVLIEIAKQGRHWGTDGVKLWVASQRPADVATHIKANAERFYFYMDDPNDIKYVERTLGKRAKLLIMGFQSGEFIYKFGRDVRLGKVVWRGKRPHITFTQTLDFREMMEAT